MVRSQGVPIVRVNTVLSFQRACLNFRVSMVGNYMGIKVFEYFGQLLHPKCQWFYMPNQLQSLKSHQNMVWF